MSDTAESAGALGTLFFYVMFVHPVCAWILAPKRFHKDRAIVYAIAFLATIAIGKMVREGQRSQTNKKAVRGVCRCVLRGVNSWRFRILQQSKGGVCLVGARPPPVHASTCACGQLQLVQLYRQPAA